MNLRSRIDRLERRFPPHDEDEEESRRSLVVAFQAFGPYGMEEFIAENPDSRDELEAMALEAFGPDWRAQSRAGC